jgi:hypothetical protein
MGLLDVRRSGFGRCLRLWRRTSCGGIPTSLNGLAHYGRVAERTERSRNLISSQGLPMALGEDTGLTGRNCDFSIGDRQPQFSFWTEVPPFPGVITSDLALVSARAPARDRLVGGGIARKGYQHGLHRLRARMTRKGSLWRYAQARKAIQRRAKAPNLPFRVIRALNRCNPCSYPWLFHCRAHTMPRRSPISAYVLRQAAA